jgi:hypothetical protein
MAHYINDIIPKCFKDEIKLTNLGFTYKNADGNLVYVYFGRGNAFLGKNKLVCMKCTSKQDFKSSEVHIMKRFYYCAGICQLGFHFKLNNAYAIVFERPSERCVTLDEIVQLNGQKCHERVNEQNRYLISVTESIAKKIFKAILDIVNECYLRKVCHLQWNELKNFWIDLDTYQVQLWNFEQCYLKNFIDREAALLEEQNTIFQLGMLLKTLVGDLKVSYDCQFLVEKCLQENNRPTLKELRYDGWFDG